MFQALNADADEHPERFDVVICTDTSCVQVRGELDLVTAPELERLLDQLRYQGHRRITLDLSRVEFLSAAGLGVFCRADQALRAAGGRLVLTRPTRIAHRILEITGLAATLSIQSIPRQWVALAAQVDSRGVT